MKFAGFNWDDGNLSKCEKHGATRASIEWALEGEITLFDDPYDSDIEKRFRAIGKDESGRHVFIVFSISHSGNKRLIRPISARYMHKKEIESYERQNKT